jgi:hypothetical protein
VSGSARAFLTPTVMQQIAAEVGFSDEGDGRYDLETAVGTVPVAVRTQHAVREASLTSVEPTLYGAVKDAA